MGFGNWVHMFRADYYQRLAALKWHWHKVQQLGVERELMLREQGEFRDAWRREWQKMGAELLAEVPALAAASIADEVL